MRQKSARRRYGHFRRRARGGNRFEKAKMIDHRMMGEAAKPRRRPMRQCFRLAALEAFDIGRREGLDVVEMAEEIPAPEAAPVFAVGHDLKTQRRLLGHGAADRLVLDRLEIRLADLTTFALGARIFDFQRAQQTADLLGAERRFRRHCLASVFATQRLARCCSRWTVNVRAAPRRC